MNDFKNPEGYADPTAYHAITKIQGEDMEKGMQTLRRIMQSQKYRGKTWKRVQ